MLSAASRNLNRRVRRWSAALGALVLVGSYVGCGFPNYTYDDNAFYEAGTAASGGSSASGGTSGTGASGGSGGSVTGGSGGVGGSAGAGGSTGGSAGAGGTSGAGGSTGGSGGVGGSTGGTGGGTGTENCTNGKDDDGNGKIDCADPACQNAGYSCAPTVASWSGPVAMWSGTTGSEPSCKGDYIAPATSGNSNLKPGTATCQTCSCNAPTGGSCSDVDIEYFDTSDCSGAGCWGCPPSTPFTLTSGGACTIYGEIHGPSGESPKAAMFTPPTASGSSCNPKSTGSANIPTPTWGNAVVACGGEPTGGKGCGDVTTECVPKPSSPFNSICIYKTGDNTCPAGAYTKKHLYYTSFNDGRSCSACSCGSPTGQSCTGTVTTSTDACSSNKTVMNTPNQCYAIPADNTTSTYDGGLEDTRGVVYTGGTPSGGSCSASGGQVTGSATETGAITFCCL